VVVDFQIDDRADRRPPSVVDVEIDDHPKTTRAGAGLLNFSGLLLCRRPCLAAGMNAEAEKIIAQLGLAPLPREGGFFRQTWVSSTQLANGRAAGSAIWFLLMPGDFSALHRLPAEELWHFYSGDPVEHVQLDLATRGELVTRLGLEMEAREVSQLVVPGGVWQGARIAPGPNPRGWALLGCTLTPAWDEREFELGSRAALTREFPAAAGWIGALTR